ncbi:peptidyl-tRNA hydrolase isoform X4 [Pan paniscus]|uniref:peptidyl-tRNA hydrolase isoform X4 n=1 Tax=Pan paniscus TaxID=9597 RepID=UPI00300641D4
MTSGGGVGVNGGSMRPGGFLGAGQRLSRAMSRCVLEPRPPGKRWMVSGVGRRRRGSRSLASVRPLCPGSRVPPNCCSVFLTGGWPGESRTARHATQRGHGGAGAAGAAAGCGGELDARPALCRRPRPGPAGGCPTGPAPATAAYERQRAQRGPGWQCQGCGLVSGARRTLRRFRPMCWAASPLLSRSCCLCCWIEPPT